MRKCHWKRITRNHQCIFLFFAFVKVRPMQQMIYIDSKAQLTLLGSEMDYVEEKLASEFVFKNPNIKGTCGCGESFNV